MAQAGSEFGLRRRTEPVAGRQDYRGNNENRPSEGSLQINREVCHTKKQAETCFMSVYT